MPDPGSSSSRWIAGVQLVAAQLDVVNDLLPYFLHQTNGSFLPVTVSPADLYSALQPSLPPQQLTLGASNLTLGVSNLVLGS